ncbi:MAG TPA: ABC transporter ATP-binding protein [Gaiellaceae bacterium]|nr:ABC transporter ATP-binding protein [Gaiellaceae bacterium]
MARIDFKQLCKTFPGGTVAVDALDLEIADGEFMVVVGPSGSGKTTVLRIAAGLDEPTSGEVWIGDDLVNGIAPMDRNIAMVFQSYALYPHMTVYENMAFGLKLHGFRKREIEPRVHAAAQMLGIDELLKRKPGQLSGGQRQRVAMGRAIVREPDAFLMDEPLSNLDAKLRVEMRAYLATLHQRLRTTTLYVTHDQTEAMTMGDRVAVMRDGRLQQVDAPQRLYDHPVNLFVAGFIGSPAMNLVQSSLIERDGGIYAAFGPASLRIPDQVLAARPRLRGYVGRPVVVGLRPEDVEDAAFVPSANGATIDVDVSLAEAMGAELIAHFPLDARPVDAGAPLLAVASAAGDDTSTQSLLAREAGGETIVTARLNPRSAARTGQPLRVALDAERLHFFDPATEAAI